MANRFPLEIVALIANSTVAQAPPRITLVPYALVNRTWQAAFEREIWNNITVSSSTYTSDAPTKGLRTSFSKRRLTLTQFEQLTEGTTYNRYARRTAIQNIHYQVVLPHDLAYGLSRTHVDHDLEGKWRAENDEAFGREVFRLFHVLQTWDRQGRSLSLSITLQAEDENIAQQMANLTLAVGIETPETSVLPRYLASLPSDFVLPEVNRVTSLEFPPDAPSYHHKGLTDRIGHPAALKIASACMSLQSLKLGPMHKFQAVRVSHRTQLREATTQDLSNLPPDLREFELHWYPWLRSHHDLFRLKLAIFSTPIILHHDPLSTMLMQASHQLRRLSLHGLEIHPEIFGPAHPEFLDVTKDSPDATQTWPNLEVLQITGIPYRMPDGQPLRYQNDNRVPFVQPEIAGIDLTERPYYKPHRRPKSRLQYRYLDTLYASFGHAVARMPRLQELDVSFGRGEDGFRLVERRATLSGEKRQLFTFRSTHGYAPTWATLALFGVARGDVQHMNYQLFGQACTEARAWIYPEKEPKEDG